MLNTLRLSIMMFMQYFVHGAWSMTIGAVLAQYGMQQQIGTTYALLGLATIISPLFVGMIADRFIASQKVIGLLHTFNGAIFFIIPFTILNQQTVLFFLLIFIAGLIYYPTMALSNSITFYHITQPKLFPFIRVLGNLGFICVGLIMGYYQLFDNIMTFKLASVTTIVLGLYCFTLPNTPPTAKNLPINWRTICCLDALILLKDKYIIIFMITTLAVMFTKVAYSAYIPVYLKVFQLNAANLMQIAVGAEVVFMLSLAYFLKKCGFKWILFIGSLAWGIRAYILSIASVSEHYLTYILIALLLQGICWTFFFIAGDMYINHKASAHIRTQAQGLKFIFSNGIGVILASIIIGRLNNHIITAKTIPTLTEQWAEFWFYSASIALIAAIFFLFLFKEKIKEN